MNRSERGRLHRFCGSGWTHVSLLVLCSLLLWVTCALRTHYWWLALFGVTAVAPLLLVAGVVSILVDRRRGLRSRTHTLVLTCDAILVAECGWHWFDLVNNLGWGP